MSSDSATVAEEEYLQSLFWLQEAGLPMTGANVARAMQLSITSIGLLAAWLGASVLVAAVVAPAAFAVLPSPFA